MDQMLQDIAELLATHGRPVTQADVNADASEVAHSPARFAAFRQHYDQVWRVQPRTAEGDRALIDLWQDYASSLPNPRTAQGAAPAAARPPGLGVVVPPPSERRQPLQRPGSLNRVLVGVAVLAIIVGAAVGFFATRRGGQTSFSAAVADLTNRSAQAKVEVDTAIKKQLAITGELSEAQDLLQTAKGEVNPFNQVTAAVGAARDYQKREADSAKVQIKAIEDQQTALVNALRSVGSLVPGTTVDQSAVEKAREEGRKQGVDEGIAATIEKIEQARREAQANNN